MPSFLTSIADKAQSALNASPLAQHLPGHGRPGSPDGGAQPTANEAAAQGGHRSHALDAIQYQLRTFGQQYSSTTPVQKIITVGKGIAIDFDSVSRDAKAQSKELYTWGQTEQEDLKDVTDRLAYLNFVQGSLASSLATKLDSARSPFKALRDAETSITPRRNIRAGLQLQLTRIEHEQQRGMEKKIAELKDQIRKAELDDQPQEKEIDILKRKAVRESEQLKWEAIREYGEKLVLLSQAATPIISALPTLPPTPSNPYAGTQTTGAVRASLQRALDNYKTGHINLPPQNPGADLSRSDTLSFGESHASELSSITSDTSTSVRPGIPLTPPPTNNQPLQSTPPSSYKDLSPAKSQSPPIDPSTLNQSPALIPTVNQSPTAIPVPFGAPSSSNAPVVSNTSTQLPTITPTVAETGVPLAAGASGPGPASGTLRDVKSASPTAGPRSGGRPGNEPQAPAYGQTPPQGFGTQKYESAEEEKKRLQREDRDRVLAAGGGSTQSGNTLTPKYETAEEEKKRLEREEREKILRDGGTTQDSKKGDDDLPPYQDY